jgi:hypothetical protein
MSESAFDPIRELEGKLEQERYERAKLEREVRDATNMVAVLVLKAGGKVFVSDNEMAAGFKTISTFPNVAKGGMDIEVFHD